jgi:hypothetical protein
MNAAPYIAVPTAGLIGALTIAAVGTRFTRSAWGLASGAALAGLALALLTDVVCGWWQHGFDVLQAWVLPLACLMLILVMVWQNWFVFYEDRRDAVQSARPTLAILGATLATLVADRRLAGDLQALSLIWAGAISLAVVWSIRPLQRSIALNRSLTVGVLVGISKILVPLAGIVVFIALGVWSRSHPAPPAEPAHAAPTARARLADLGRLGGDLVRLLLVTLINGGRVAPEPVTYDPFGLLRQQRGAESVARNTVVMILVLAIHLLCGVVIVRQSVWLAPG